MPGLKWILQAVIERILPHKYDPVKYWEKRLKGNFNLIGVGNRRYSEEKNREMYDVKKNIFSGMLKNVNIDIAGKKVLEIGCGVGYWTEYCRDSGCADYVGIDISETAVRTLQEEYPDYRFISGDVSELKMDEQFEIVLMIDVTQHIVDDEKFKKSMEFIKSSLEKNGHFVVTSWLRNKVRDKYY
ncbi:class I SAM-dependent methyltransferase, partial [bacterium]|nr:class I SAM-dependent methyltransferase [bacterium]